MRVAAVQTKPEFGKVNYNLQQALKLMASVEADLFVLPELFSTGYLFTSREEARSFSELSDGPTLSALARFSDERQCVIFAGFAERDSDDNNSKIYNSSALIDKGQIVGVYRKLHLFNEEKQIFDISHTPPLVISTDYAKLGLMICFDWVFPEMARSLALQGAAVICHCANLVLHYCQQTMISRSVENGVFTVLANRVGEDRRDDKSLTFTGLSEIISPKGEVLAQASKDSEEVILCDIDPELSDDKQLTPYNHLFSDRRTDMYFV